MIDDNNAARAATDIARVTGAPFVLVFDGFKAVFVELADPSASPELLAELSASDAGRFEEPVGAAVPVGVVTI